MRTVRDLAPPAWAQELVERRDDDAGRFALISVRVEDALDLAPQEFERQTCEAYVSIARQLDGATCPHAVRFWNHVPQITDPADAGRDNYMVFNAGRFRAFSDWYGGPAHFERDVATASAIGHAGKDLVVHCLAADVTGIAVNNPRQVAPYHYSQRFGPLPPCFARATRFAARAAGDLLLVGGTASVRGEDSVHVGDLASQLRETFVNLAALTGTAIGRRITPSLKLATWLSAFRELRVYYPNRDDRAEIELAIADKFPSLRRLEMLRADLCRSELLVEIEGLADLSALESPKSFASSSVSSSASSSS